TPSRLRLSDRPAGATRAAYVAAGRAACPNRSPPRGIECEDARVPDDPTAFLLDEQAFAGDPFPAYARLRAEAPVARNTQVGFWVFSKHADVLAASTDPTTFCSRQGILLFEVGAD